MTTHRARRTSGTMKAPPNRKENDHVKRAVTAALAVLAVITGLAIPASATSATGPFKIRTMNANICLGFSPDEPNVSVTQQDNAENTHCRHLFFSKSGNVNGKPKGEWLTSNGHAIASPNCTPQNGGNVAVEPAHSVGTTWINDVQSGGAGVLVVNQRCDHMLPHSDCLMVLAATGSIGQPFFVVNYREVSGVFVAMVLEGVSAPHRVTAGC
jgi:hypothetical protein